MTVSNDGLLLARFEVGVELPLVPGGLLMSCGSLVPGGPVGGPRTERAARQLEEFVALLEQRRL